jgi:hypothetical protein
MRRLTGPFVAALARVWHRFDAPEQDVEMLAQMLAPMDEAGERLAQRMRFDMEPADFLHGLDAESEPPTDPDTP